MNQNYFHTNSCLHQLSSAFILDLWAASIIKTFSYKLLSISTPHPSVFIIDKERQNKQLSSELLSTSIIDLWATRRVKHCYIFSYKLLSSNSYHHYFIQLRTHLHVYQSKTLFLLLLERQTSREATSKETRWYGQFVSQNLKMVWEKTIHVSAYPNVASRQQRCPVPL